MNNPIQSKIKDYMEDFFLFEFDEETTFESDLFKAGIIDSFGYIQLIRFLEKEFQIEFTEEEMLSSVFVNFSSLIDTVSKKIN